MKIILPGEYPVSWNKFYAGSHWTYRRILAEDIHQKVVIALFQMGITSSTPPLDYRVNIKIIAYYKTTHIDSDNIPAKIYIDGLKGIVIKDDSPVYVGAVTVRSQRTTGKQRVEISIEKDEDIIDK